MIITSRKKSFRLFQGYDNYGKLFCNSGRKVAHCFSETTKSLDTWPQGSVFKILHEYPAVPGWVLPEKLGGGVRPASKNPYPI